MKKQVMTQELHAPLWRRVVAYLVDILIISMVVYVPLQIYTFEDKEEWTFSKMVEATTGRSQSAPFVVAMVIAVLLTVAYFVVLEYKVQQTVGKMLTRIKVVSQAPLTLQQCILRNVTKMGTSILFLDCLYMIKSGNQRLFEKWSNTEVVLNELPVNAGRKK